MVTDVDLEIADIVYQLSRLAVAFLLAAIIGLNRKKEARSAGLRTFPLVSVASCAYIMLATSMFGNEPNALARVLQGLITGIGFIGGGAILKNNGSVEGVATAASIWNTGAIGAAVAFRRFDFAVALTLLNFLILTVSPVIKSAIDSDTK